MCAYVLGGCALAILIGVFTKSWMSGRGGLGGVGPLGIEICAFSGACESVGWPAAAPGDLQVFGYLALFGGLAAAAASAWIGFLVISNTPNKFPAFKLINGAFGGAAFATTFFAVRLLIEGKEFSISWSPFFAIGGVVVGGIFVRKLRPYWPGEGNTPWPVAVRSAPFGGAQPPPFGGAFGAGPPMSPPGGGYPMTPAPGGQPMGPPPFSGAPHGAPAPHGGPMSGAPPYGAPPHGAPMHAPPHGLPMHAPPHGAPMNGAPPPHGAPTPHGGPLGGAPPHGAPMNAPPHGAPMHAPPHGAPFGAPVNAPPAPPFGAAPNAPPASAPLPYAATMVASPQAPGAAPHNKATIMGAPAPQLAAILKQPPAQGASPPSSPHAGAVAGPQAAPQGAPQFCGRCGKSMTFVAQYQRWFCQHCQQYA